MIAKDVNENVLCFKHVITFICTFHVNLQFTIKRTLQSKPYGILNIFQFFTLSLVSMWLLGGVPISSWRTDVMQSKQ